MYNQLDFSVNHIVSDYYHQLERLMKTTIARFMSPLNSDQKTFEHNKEFDRKKQILYI